MAKKTDTGITDKGSTTTVPKIEMRDVVKSFGSKHVLKGIDLAVNAEESLALIGTSGCGKSITLKCLLGLITADGGSIKVDGTEILGTQKNHKLYYFLALYFMVILLIKQSKLEFQ